MNKAIFVIVSIFILAVLGIYFFTKINKKDLQFYQLKTNTMKISSPAFENNQPILSKYTCDGENISPPLQIENIPKEAVSLVLIVDDPDAPKGTWTHWIVWNIPPQTKEIPENSLPKGAIEGITDFKKPGYGGPCPPSGTHRYFFKLYALESAPDLKPGSDKPTLEKAMNDHIIDNAELIGLYRRQK